MNTATENQLSLIKRLVDERDLSRIPQIERIVETGREQYRAGEFSSRRASLVIEALLSMSADAPRATARNAEGDLLDLKPGVYSNGDSTLRVYWNQGQDRLLAKRVELDEDGSGYEYTYLGMASRVMTQDGPWERLTLKEASDFGHATGVCVCCGRTLTDAESVDLGIGPICKRKYID